MLTRSLLLAALLGLAGWSGGYAQDKPKDSPKKPKKEPETAPAPKEVKGETAKSSPAPKKPGQPGKYDDVITKDAKTQPGVFAVHRIDEKVYFEIPQDKFGKLMLFRAEMAQAPAGMGGMSAYNGAALGTKFVRFERRENKVYVYEAGFDKRGSKDTELAVKAAGGEPILAAFQVEAEGKDRSAVVLATTVFMADVLDVGAKRAVPGGGIESDKSFLNDVKAFPNNIEARATLTFRSGGGSPLGVSVGGGSRTALVHYSLAALPDEPMAGRYFDPRVGYFSESFQEYGGPAAWMKEKQFIARFRLEKKDPKAEVSEPVKPIVFYLAAEIPEKWRAYMKKGVEDWKPAFEKAGFKNAIVCKDPPSRSEDPNWDPEDARYNVIRWVADPVANAMGPHVHDPRSGEIISAHIVFWHDILKITHLWYFTQCSAVDERARKFPFPDDLTGELIRYVTAHEVGHTLGLRHNHRASQAYTVEQLRDPEFVKEHGSVASIMSYGRYNYVAQPEDKIPPADLIPKIAPYDLFAIEWGYKPIPDAKTPADEKKTLDEWASRQVKEPFLRFGGEDGPSIVDPTVLTENIGNDPVAATAMGLKNLDRVLEYLVKSTTEKGEDFTVLEEAYSSVMSHRRNWYGAVLKQVGGVVENRTLGGSPGEQFTRVPEEKQRAAVKFLVESAFATPSALFKPEIVNQFRFTGVANDVMGQQRALLTGLLSGARLSRLLDAEIQAPDTAYTVGELVADVQAGLWKELAAEAPKVDPLRRNLQRAYLDTLKAEFEPTSAAGSVVIPTSPRRAPILDFGGPSRVFELRAVARVALKDLKKQIEAAVPKTKDAVTKAHLEDSLSVIDEALDPAKRK